MNKRIALKIYGRVQLVMYRDWARRQAKKIGITGWVKNEPDNTVSVVAEGNEQDLKKFIKLCYNGPILAKVEKIDIIWQEPSNEFTCFKILY